MIRAFLTLGTTALLALSACAPKPTDQVDLVAEAPFAEWRSERREVPLGDVDAVEFGTGWARPERDAHGNDFRWAKGSSSTVTFYCGEPRPLTLTLSLRPFRWPGAPPQGVRCLFNGKDLGREIIHGKADLEFDLPATLVRGGDNVLEFQWDRATRVSDIRQSRDHRELAAAVSAIVVDGLADGSSPKASSSDRGVVVAAGAEYRVAAWTGEESILDFDLDDGSGENLQIWTRDDATEFRMLCGPCDDGSSLPLENTAGPVQIAFRTTGPSDSSIRHAAVRWRDFSAHETEDTSPDSLPQIVVLFVTDTLRADRLSCYGGPEGISPALDDLAADGVLFERAIAQSSWTKPTVVTILSGLSTTEHGVRSREPKIPEAVESIAGRFQRGGYRTGGFTTNAYLTPSAGFDRGFDTFEYAQLNAREVTHRALDWLEESDDGRPVFLWIHTVEPHAPYRAGASYRNRWAPEVGPEIGTVEHVQALGGRPPEVTAPFAPQFLGLYDAEVAQNDAALGEILSVLKDGGRYDDSCVVFLSDHGEEFWEHGVNGHGWDLYEEVLHVPLVVKPPRWRSGGLRVSQPVAQIDVAPTVLGIAGLDVPANLSGRDLLSPAVEDRRVIFSEMTYEGREGVAVRSGRFKLINPLSSNFLAGPHLFDLAADPEERRNVHDRYPATAAWLAQEGRRGMERLATAPRPEDDMELSAEERRGLEALGYLDPEPPG